MFGPERQLAFILAAALFAVVGLLLCVFSLRGLIRKEYVMPSDEEEQNSKED